MAHCPQQGHTYEAHHQSPSKGLIQLVLKSHYYSSLCRGCQVNHLETGLSFSHSANNHWSPTWCQITLCVLSTCHWKKQCASFQRQGRRQTMRYKQIKVISDTNNDYRENKSVWKAGEWLGGVLSVHLGRHALKGFCEEETLELRLKNGNRAAKWKSWGETHVQKLWCSNELSMFRDRQKTQFTEHKVRGKIMRWDRQTETRSWKIL